jgi:hypothetical protein
MVLLVLRGIDQASFREAAKILGKSHIAVFRQWNNLLGRLKTLAQVEVLYDRGKIEHDDYQLAKLHWGSGWSIREISRRMRWGRRRIAKNLDRLRDMMK